jgi:uncharacterized membrane protein (DUF441 family)
VDWVTGAATLITGLIRTHKMNEWFKLILQLVASDVISWQFAEGSALAATTPPLIARGMGLVAGSVMAVVIWRRSPLTRGLMLALPAKEATVELDSNIQVVANK